MNAFLFFSPTRKFFCFSHDNQTEMNSIAFVLIALFSAQAFGSFRLFFFKDFLSKQMQLYHTLVLGTDWLSMQKFGIIFRTMQILPSLLAIIQSQETVILSWVSNMLTMDRQWLLILFLCTLRVVDNFLVRCSFPHLWLNHLRSWNYCLGTTC